MNTLFERGILVQIKSGMWSMEASLAPKDIDIQDKDLPDFVHLGYKRLFPKEVKNRFTAITARVRTLTNRYGFDFFLTGAYFVPNSSLDNLLPELERAQVEFYKEVESFTEKYNKAKVSYLNAYPEHRAHLAPYYPDVEVVRSKFFMNIWCYKVDSPGVPVGQFAEMNDEVYVDWATDAVNGLRQEAIEVADSIGKSILDDTLNGRNLRKVKTLIDRLAALDLVGDQDLLKAARTVASEQSMEATRVLKKAAASVSTTRIRKLILD